MQPQFGIGQVVHHKRFDYRGAIIDVDPMYQGSEAWYEQMARSQPPRDAPWYHVLVDGASHRTYVAERHLEPDNDGGQIQHPELGTFFRAFVDGRYVARETPD